MAPSPFNRTRLIHSENNVESNVESRYDRKGVEEGGTRRRRTVLEADNPLFFASSADYALRKCVRTRGTRA